MTRISGIGSATGIPILGTLATATDGAVLWGRDDLGRGMPSRGRHQSSSKECLRMIRKVEALVGVSGVIIGRSYGGKSLGRGGKTGTIRVQREVSGGLKAVTQTAKGVQELFIRTEAGCEKEVWEKIDELQC